jgi:hypothetical protein
MRQRKLRFFQDTRPKIKRKKAELAQAKNFDAAIEKHIFASWKESMGCRFGDDVRSVSNSRETDRIASWNATLVLRSYGVISRRLTGSNGGTGFLNIFFLDVSW